VLRLRQLHRASAIRGRVLAQPHSFCLAYLFVKLFAASPVSMRLALRFTWRLRCTTSFHRAQNAGSKRPPAAAPCCGRQRPAAHASAPNASGCDRGGVRIAAAMPRAIVHGDDVTSGLALPWGKQIVRESGAVVRFGLSVTAVLDIWRVARTPAYNVAASGSQTVFRSGTCPLEPRQRGNDETPVSKERRVEWRSYSVLGTPCPLTPAPCPLNPEP
jgi:hypothetical protein